MYTVLLAPALFALSSLQGGPRPVTEPQGPARATSSVEKGPSSSWAARIEQDLREGEYAFNAVTGRPGLWSAPNRSNELRSRLSSEGLEVFPRSVGVREADAPWIVRLRTKSLGRDGEVCELAAPAITVHGRRAELDHGRLLEWFENRERGIEHGWTITERPGGAGALRIDIEIVGALTRFVGGGGCTAEFTDDGVNVLLRYQDLTATDATGKLLEARLQKSRFGIGIAIDDREAVYPIEIDPMLCSGSWSDESNQAGAQYGFSVAWAGDVTADGFDDLIVGVPWFDSGEPDEGRVYVYCGSATGLSTTPCWCAESDTPGALFGYSVSRAGDVFGTGIDDVIVGAPNYTNGQSNEGGAFIFSGIVIGGGFCPTTLASASWKTESDQVDAFLGYSVSTAGDVNGDGFDDVIVGAYGYDSGQTDEGGAFAYYGALFMPSIPSWTAVGGELEAAMGFSVSTAGDVNFDGFDDVIVGLPHYNNPDMDEGAAWVYLGSASGLAASPIWMNESNQPNALYGISVSTAGDVNGDGFGDVIVGAYGYDNGETDEGEAWAYYGSSTGLPLAPSWTCDGDQADAQYGLVVASAGDVNGDGFSDVIVSAPRYDYNYTDEGRVYVYLGSPAGLPSNCCAAFTDEGKQAGAGCRGNTAGDVNNDGFSDLIIGAPLYDNPEVDEGRAWLVCGSANWSCGLATAATCVGDSINLDTLSTTPAIINHSWRPTVTIGHFHGAGGPVNLKVRTICINGPNFSAPPPWGFRLTEILIAGPLLASLFGTHNGTSCSFSAPVPYDYSLIGFSFAAQALVVGGGFADYSTAMTGVVGTY